MLWWWRWWWWWRFVSTKWVELRVFSRGQIAVKEPPVTQMEEYLRFSPNFYLGAFFSKFLSGCVLTLFFTFIYIPLMFVLVLASSIYPTFQSTNLRTKLNMGSGNQHLDHHQHQHTHVTDHHRVCEPPSFLSQDVLNQLLLKRLFTCYVSREMGVGSGN